jgi:hypothetical protein
MKEIVNMKKINITKYKGNTHYNIHVIDSFGQEHHLGFFYCHINGMILKDKLKKYGQMKLKMYMTIH